jgi:hypothetical protein
MAASGAIFEKKRESKISIKDKNYIELDELEDSNKNVSQNYVESNEDAEHEHIINIEDKSVIKNVSLSDILILKKQLQECKQTLKKEIDAVSWCRLFKYLTYSSVFSTCISGVGEMASLGVRLSSGSDVALNYFWGFGGALGLSACVVVGAIKGWNAESTCSYPFPIRKSITYPLLGCLLTEDKVNKIMIVSNVINSNFFSISITKTEDSRNVLEKLNQAEKYIQQKEMEVNASIKKTGSAVLEAFKSLNQNGFFRDNSNNTPNLVQKTILKYLVPEESIIDDLFSSRGKRGFC